MSYSYLTLSNKIEDISFKEKGSRFISYAYPVLDEEDVKKKLADLWALHPDATHICYAYRLGLEGEDYRANDDGEPSGSAGLPIYNQILSKNITFVLVASVRYYGGTKLGVPGLVKAYKQSAQLALDEAEITEKHLTEKVGFEFSYEDQGAVMRNVDRFGAEVLETEFTDSCRLLVSVKKQDVDNFLASFEPLYKVKIQKFE
ncbi:MAG: YigZ family protein [Flavobacteriia bacterium]|nr:YigZ family protein [Flavobacteriia bacterium]